VRPIHEIRIWGRSCEKAARVAETLANELHVAVAVAADLVESTAWADIISCATLSMQPLVLGRHLRPGQHLDLVGAYTPAMRETDDDAVARARIFVDSRASALTEAGDLIQSLNAGRITAVAIQGELAELARGEIRGRESPDQVTLFKSVGLALEDLAAAELALGSR
jgi:ornithine cyclodeaminase